MAKVDEKRIEHLLARNVEKVIDRGHLAEALRSGRKLRVKLGIDPTSPDLHLGHAVVLWKLREFQELDHTIVLIIGDFTAQVGDPSGRSETRKVLSEKEIATNQKKYVAHAGTILDIKKVEIRHNSEWFATEGVGKLIQLASAGSIQQVLRRADFRKRLRADQDVTLLEVMYPLLQGYDSVKVEADVELGGTDQLFNLLMGRRVQRHFGMGEQDVMTTSLLEGLDGVKKMSKSLGNYISLDEKPAEMFGKVMSIPDSLIVRYFTLATEVPEPEIKEFERALADRRANPKDIKEKLAHAVVGRYHGEKEAVAAAEKFNALFSRKEAIMLSDLPLLQVNLTKEKKFRDVILKTGVVATKSSVQRLIQQGAIQVTQGSKIVRVRNPWAASAFLKDGDVIKIGKRHFFRVKVL
ncbi:MAG: tyrosine--tRNA ligase [Candidatus Liptonbacteria bacterium]|nr:tyrosine--tRNA ligase [Candidatus Liptonbacteria bacterium]